MPTPEWITDAWPYLKGAIGWGTASFIVENFIKPRKALRQLAHVLAEEISLNLQMIVGQLAWYEIHPKEIPADLHLLDGVYTSNTARIGELPESLTGPMILFYERIANINRLTADLGRTAERIQMIKRDPDRHGGANALQAEVQHIERGIKVYTGAFMTARDEADFLLRRLRVLETFGGRVGYWFRSKPMLNPEELRRRVKEHAKKLGD